MVIKYEKFLPLGTLVKINKKLKRVMIIGFCFRSENDKTKYYDYVGCIYPNGLLNFNEFFMFNHEDIEEVSVLGYSDQEDYDFKLELKEKLKEYGEFNE